MVAENNNVAIWIENEILTGICIGAILKRCRHNSGFLILPCLPMSTFANPLPHPTVDVISYGNTSKKVAVSCGVSGLYTWCTLKIDVFLTKKFQAHKILKSWQHQMDRD